MTRTLRAASLVLVLLVLGRFVLAAVLPLTDTTEARYGEIARKMVETKDWITPQHDYGVPFWGKPPLAFWASAGGIEALGPSQLAPRLPILLLSLGFLGLVFAWLKPQVGRTAAALSTVILASSLVFYVSMAAVMTDMVLTICVGAGLIAFWERYRGGSRRWEIVLYAALGLGLLAKGPLATVLTLAPIVLWSLALGRVRTVWRRFAWLKGMLLVAAIALPWYIAAEIKTPGFLKYFIVGEYLSRFLIPDWQGDLYGNAHQEPFGTIWAFFVVGLLPWSVLLLPLPLTRRKTVRGNFRQHRDLIVLCLAWALVPLLLFTAAANIISPYVLPAMPGFVAAFVALYARPGEDRTLGTLAWVGTACLLLPLAGLALKAEQPGFVTRFTQRDVVADIRKTHPQGCEIRYWQDRYFSAEYYTQGRARWVKDPGKLTKVLDQGKPLCLVVGDDRLGSLPKSLAARLHTTERLGHFSVLEPLAVRETKQAQAGP
ncbi:MAG TPA: phospholipid carrier-dependent glycosyltransferase [Gammaproteobacteria bacterium]|nr:phospholipid carrier-dependent glycosyltransferase [Gammaproteobacteria bacterium]